ncbi:MAG: hypothetical protein ACXVC6_01220 [Bacteroidia bacterium]
MYKKHLLQNIEREIVLLKQLTPFIEEKDLAFRPAEKVRSTYEVMQYISGIGEVMMHWFIVGMTPEYREKIAARRSTLTLVNFPERLDEQWQNIQKYFETINDEDLVSKMVEMPSKEKMELGAAIINGPIKWLATYRMQIFVNLKANGKDQLSTKEAWVIPAPAVNN